MKQKTTYLTPVIQMFEINAKCVLCLSNPAGAGVLSDNSWELTYGEE